MSFFQGVLYGRLGNNPDPRQTQKGQEMSVMSVGWTDTSPEKKTQWCRVKAFGKTANFCNKYLQKGDAIIVSGTMNLSDYVGNDGIERKNCELLASRVESCSRPNRTGFQQDQGEYAQGHPQHDDPAQENGQPPPFPQMPNGSNGQSQEQGDSQEEMPF